MVLTEEEVMEGFLALPLDQRVSLRVRMDEALIQEMEPSELEKCLDLADARYEAYKAGKIKAIDYKDVLAYVKAAVD